MLDEGYKPWVLTILMISYTKCMAQSYCKVNNIIHVMWGGERERERKKEKKKLFKIYGGSHSYTSKEKY
jgi:hypothetical protein